LSQPVEPNHYEAPRSSLVAPPEQDWTFDDWPLVVKLLAAAIIAECVAHVAIPMVIERGLAWPDFGKLMVSSAILLSVYKRNRWGWILAVVVPALWTPFSIWGAVQEDWSRLPEYVSIASEFIPWYLFPLLLPGMMAFTLLFFPSTLRWFFGKHSERQRLATITICVLIVLGHLLSFYGRFLAEREQMISEKQQRAMIEELEEQNARNDKTILDLHEELEKLERQSESGD